jgi:sirohydrochlorin ferrochelatase
MAINAASRLVALLTLGLFAFAAAPQALATTGVLVVAMDRGTVGNQELAAAVKDLDPDFPVELLLIGPDRQGIENGYRTYLEAARDALLARGADEVLAVPLLVSGGDPLLARFRDPIEAAFAPAVLTWTPAFGDSYLAREVLLDRIQAASAERQWDRLILLLSGGDAAHKAGIEALGARLLDNIRPLVSIPEMTVELVDPDAPADDDTVAGTERVLVVPFMIDVKFTPHMSLEATLGRRFSGDNVHVTESVMPHPGVRIWLQSMIDAHVPATDETIGFIIMPHGSTAPYNDGIVAAMPEIVRRYPTAFAFGMASAFTITQAVRELEAAGVRHVVFLRLFAQPHHFRDTSDYILGLRPEPPAHNHGGVPARVRTPLRFVTLGGYQEDVLISAILKDRILEASKEPARESVVILSHGSGDDAGNAAGLAVVERNIADIQSAIAKPFREIRAMALREDWPEKQAEAVREIREFIATASRNGRAIVVSNRLYGSGSYAEYLQGLDFVMNGQGLIPHPNFTRWVEMTLEAGMAKLLIPGNGDSASSDPAHPSK